MKTERPNSLGIERRKGGDGRPPMGIERRKRNVCTTSGELPEKVRAEQTEPTGQHKAYLVLCDAERAKGFVKPVRNSYRHKTCGTETRMGRKLAETYARDPYFYGATFCCGCNVHRALAEFTWLPDGEPMDPHDPAWQIPGAPQESK